jgi:hypothetical protein
MMFFLRWPIVLILLFMAAMSAFPAALGAIATYNLPVDTSILTGASNNVELWASSTTLPERILWYAAAVFFFIAAVRLIRRTQAFWMWLLGFACWGGRWALGQHEQEGGIAATLQGVASLEAFQPDTLAQGSSGAQVGFLGFLLIIGLLIFVVDGADRDYWERQGG